MVEKDLLRIKQALQKIIKEVVSVETKACFRLYQAKVVTVPNGKTCGVQLIGDKNTINLHYSDLFDKVSVGDIVWVVTIYDSFSNAIVLFPNNFNFNLDNRIANLVYPVGSIYMSIQNVSPASLFGGTWEMLPSGYALWTTNSGAGGVISEGLPNITGSVNNLPTNGKNNATNFTSSGAFGITVDSDNLINGYAAYAHPSYDITFDAGKSNSIYGKTNNVQPNAYKIYAWQRLE